MKYMMDGREQVDVISLRSKPRLIVLDESFRIVFADWTAMLTLLRICENPQEPIEVLPAPLHDTVRDIVATWDSRAATECVVEPMPDVVLRISRMSGVARSYVAVFCESRTRRDDVRYAAATFSLTKREAEVLTLILRGFNAAEIAEELSIAETTVGDYFKQLLKKTRAKNRTDMIARVLGWAERKGGE